nr:integrase, catalytic region, zinc finger, CCHC-type, peptidase aspartic, catalytic [Tanacetum cinerariifolium]
EPLAIPLDEIQVDHKLNFIEEPVEIMDREVKRLKQSRILIVKIVQICLWIINSGCSKHMTGNRALLTNFVEKFLGTVRFGNKDFAVIAGYGDVVIGSMTIKKVYYVEGLGHKVNVLDSNFNLGSTICKIFMPHVPPESNEFEVEIIPCNDFRLGTSQPFS